MIKYSIVSNIVDESEFKEFVEPFEAELRYEENDGYSIYSNDANENLLTKILDNNHVRYILKKNIHQLNYDNHIYTISENYSSYYINANDGYGDEYFPKNSYSLEDALSEKNKQIKRMNRTNE